jgi:hypothetical protein
MHMLQRFNVRRLACFTLLIALLALAGAVQAAPARQDPYPAPQPPTADPLAPLPTPTAYPAPLPAMETPPTIGGGFDEQSAVGEKHTQSTEVRRTGCSLYVVGLRRYPAHLHRQRPGRDHALHTPRSTLRTVTAADEAV